MTDKISRHPPKGPPRPTPGAIVGKVQSAGRVGVPRFGEVKCPRCRGAGKTAADIAATHHPSMAGCDRCEGTGVVKCSICKGEGRVLEPVPDGALTYGDRTDGLASFPCDCELIKEGVAPRVRNNVSMGRANPGDADMKGKTP